MPINTRIMMTEYEVPEFIGFKLPEIEQELRAMQLPGDIYKAIQVLTDFTKKMVVYGDLKKAGKCLSLAEKIYLRGNAEVKRAVTDVFVLSFACLRLACNRESWTILLSFMPPTLYGLHLKQIRVQEINQ
jgi:hypothetical protein